MEEIKRIIEEFIYDNCVSGIKYMPDTQILPFFDKIVADLERRGCSVVKENDIYIISR